jgi:hypothetical protein
MYNNAPGQKMYYLRLYFLTNSIVTSSEVLTSECFDEDKSFFCMMPCRFVNNIAVWHFYITQLFSRLKRKCEDAGNWQNISLCENHWMVSNKFLCLKTKITSPHKMHTVTIRLQTYRYSYRLQISQFVAFTPQPLQLITILLNILSMGKAEQMDV